MSTGDVRLRPAGPDAVLVELADLDEVDAARRVLAAAVADGTLAGVVDVVPAARTVLVHAPGARGALAGVGPLLSGADLAGGTAARDATPVELGVHYDGADLEQVAADAGTDVADVVARHTARELTVAFGGFAPGFAYLTGLDPLLAQPRLDRPRERVPAGSVGVAGEFGGVYPRASPGGWRLLGRLTDDAPVLFDPDRDPPALLAPGTRVRFRDAAR